MPKASIAAATRPSRWTRRTPSAASCSTAASPRTSSSRPARSSRSGRCAPAIIAAGDPLIQDVVIAGINRGEIGILLFPRLDACREFTGLPSNAPAHIVLGHAHLRAFLQRLVDVLHSRGTGSATRVARALVLAEPPSIDRGEITDKGSINQRAVLTHRDADVVRMYLGRDRDVIVPQAH